MQYFDGKYFLASVSTKKILENPQEQIKYYLDKVVWNLYPKHIGINLKIIY